MDDVFRCLNEQGGIVRDRFPQLHDHLCRSRADVYCIVGNALNKGCEQTCDSINQFRGCLRCLSDNLCEYVSGLVHKGP